MKLRHGNQNNNTVDVTFIPERMKKYFEEYKDNNIEELATRALVINTILVLNDVKQHSLNKLINKVTKKLILKRDNKNAL